MSRTTFEKLKNLLLAPPAVAGLCLLAAFFLVYPFGYYLVDDEWAYLKSLQYLHEEGRVHILDWNPMSLVGHLAWGVLFTKMFGFSPLVGKLSTTVLFFVQGAAVAAILRHIGLSRPVAAAVTLVLIFNPLQFFHGFIYVTDIPASTWTVLAVLCTLLGLRDMSRRNQALLVLGSLLGALSFLVRQNGLLFHLALAGYLLLYDRGRLKSLAGVLSAVGIPAIVVATFQYWYRHVHGPTTTFLASQHQVLQTLRSSDWAMLVHLLVSYGMYAGFFVAPLAWALPVARPVWRFNFRSAALAAAGGFLLFRVGWLAVDGYFFPYLCNKLTPFGYCMPNEWVVGDRDMVWGPPLAWLATVVCVVALLRLLAAGLRFRPDPGNAPAQRCTRLLLLLAILQMVCLLTTYRILFDRHLLLLLPTLLLLLCAWVRPARLNWPVLTILLVPMAWYSIAGTHDVHAFSRAVFEAAEAQRAKGVTAENLDAGYAFDGWYMYERSRQEHVIRARPGDPWWVLTLTPGVHTQVIVSLSPTLNAAAYQQFDRLPRPYLSRYRVVDMLRPDLSRYQVVDRVAYRTYWPFGTRHVFVMVQHDAQLSATKNGR